MRTEKEKTFGMKTSTDREPLYVKYGEVVFAISFESKLKLNIYKNIELSKQKIQNYLFSSFSDLYFREMKHIMESILI
jgi:hypothetical protein